MVCAALFECLLEPKAVYALFPGNINLNKNENLLLIHFNIMNCLAVCEIQFQFGFKN